MITSTQLYNGLTKTMNKTILERLGSILLGVKLPFGGKLQTLLST